MIVNIDELRALPHMRLNLNFKELMEGIDAVKPVVGELTVSANSTGLRVTGTVHTLLKLNCDRCLQAYFLNLNVSIDEFVAERIEEVDEKPVRRERELTADDFVEALPADGNLDISDLVYQAVTLARPVSYLCGEDCPGPAFPDEQAKSGLLAAGKDAGIKDERIDPRWKNLKTLFPNEESE